MVSCLGGFDTLELATIRQIAPCWGQCTMRRVLGIRGGQGETLELPTAVAGANRDPGGDEGFEFEFEIDLSLSSIHILSLSSVGFRFDVEFDFDPVSS